MRQFLSVISILCGARTYFFPWPSSRMRTGCGQGALQDTFGCSLHTSSNCWPSWRRANMLPVACQHNFQIVTDSELGSRFSGLWTLDCRLQWQEQERFRTQLQGQDTQLGHTVLCMAGTKAQSVDRAHPNPNLYPFPSTFSPGQRLWHRQMQISFLLRLQGAPVAGLEGSCSWPRHKEENWAKPEPTAVATVGAHRTRTVASKSILSWNYKEQKAQVV